MWRGKGSNYTWNKKQKLIVTSLEFTTDCNKSFSFLWHNRERCQVSSDRVIKVYFPSLLHLSVSSFLNLKFYWFEIVFTIRLLKPYFSFPNLCFLFPFCSQSIDNWGREQNGCKKISKIKRETFIHISRLYSFLVLAMLTVVYSNKH